MQGLNGCKMTEVSVDGDGCGCESWDVHADAQWHRYDVAQRLAEHPALEQTLDGREGHGKQTLHHVARRQVSDKDVGDRLHRLGVGDDVDNQGIPGDADNKNHSVEGDEEDL